MAYFHKSQVKAKNTINKGIFAVLFMRTKNYFFLHDYINARLLVVYTFKFYHFFIENAIFG